MFEVDELVFGVVMATLVMLLWGYITAPEDDYDGE